MDFDIWRSANESAIRERLAPLSRMPDGILHERRTKFQHAVVEKVDRQIRLYFVESSRSSIWPKKSGFMSRIDLDRPLELIALYTCALLLSLLWVPQPKRICILGFGGGRLAMVLKHWYPELILDCVDIDPEIIDISEEYFGVESGGDLRLICQDAREYIETLPSNNTYDIIFVDCFTGAGHHPGKLSTEEFYQACRSKLTPDGVIAANILKSDPLYKRKAATFAHVFPSLNYFKHDDTNVFIGRAQSSDADDDIEATIASLKEITGAKFNYRWLLSKVVSDSPDLHLFKNSDRAVLSDDLVNRICD